MYDQINNYDDNVNHPAHYNKGGIECLAYLKAKLTPEGYEGFLAGNILKYATRYKEKNGLEDLKKIKFYNDELINFLEEQSGLQPSA